MAGIASLLITGAAQLARADANYVVETFDTEADGWSRWWGSAAQTYEWDGTVDANANPNSGSLKSTISYDIAAYGGDNQFAVQHYFAAEIDVTKYTNYVFDLKFDPSSPKRGYGDYGYFEYGFIADDYSQVWMGATSPTDNNWAHIAAAIDPTTPKLSTIRGVVFKSWAGDTGAGAQNTLKGDSIFWVDNIIFHAATNTNPPPAPTLTLSKAIPGLQLTASNPGDQYQRQNIRSVSNTGLTWVGATDPVTYSLTIGSYPDTNHTGFQTHLFLVPSASLPNYETSPDYNEPNLIFLDIQNNADGSATASFRYKTNEPAGNAMVYGAGTLASISNPSPLGQWNLTFTGNTGVTVTTPNGSSTNFAMPADAVALFADPLYVHVGAQPNNLSSIGQSVVLTDFHINAGTNVWLGDNFATDTALDTTNTWTVVAANPSGVVEVPVGSAYWVNWTAPADGYSLQTTTNLSNGSWVDAVQTFSLAPPAQIYKQYGVILPASVPDADKGYFRLLKAN